jgi:hypothetical protein
MNLTEANMTETGYTDAELTYLHTLSNDQQLEYWNAINTQNQAIMEAVKHITTGIVQSHLGIAAIGTAVDIIRKLRFEMNQARCDHSYDTKHT